MSKDGKEIVNSYSKGFLLGAIVGGAVGAITALLLAPKSGKELREDLSRKSSDLIDKAQDIIGEKQTQILTGVNEGKIQADKIVQNAKEQAGSLMNSADRMIQEARFRASSAKEIIQDNTAKIMDAVKVGSEAFKQEMASVKSQDTELL